MAGDLRRKWKECSEAAYNRSTFYAMMPAAYIQSWWPTTSEQTDPLATSSKDVLRSRQSAAFSFKQPTTAPPPHPKPHTTIPAHPPPSHSP